MLSTVMSIDEQPPEEADAAIGERIRLTREAMGLTQTSFSEAVGIGQNLLSQYESGKKHLSDRSARAIRRRFRVTLDWLYCGDASNNPLELMGAIKALKRARRVPH